MSDVEECRWVQLQVFDDPLRGCLNAGEHARQIPFEIKRFYAITGLNRSGAVRGRHAHAKLEQVIFCLRGSAELFLDDGAKVKTLRLERPDAGVYLHSGIWHEMKGFKGDPVLLVLASGFYSESDYIRGRAEFRRAALEKKVSG